MASVIDLPPIFDAFGTLVEITDKRQAFRPLFKALPPDNRRELKYWFMREDRPFTHWLNALEVEVLPHTLLEVMERLMIEIGSTALRLGMAGVWARLRHEGLKRALCSTLSSDYIPALRGALLDCPDVEVLSCKVGAIKPEPAIYAKPITFSLCEPMAQPRYSHLIPRIEAIQIAALSRCSAGRARCGVGEPSTS